MHFIQILESHTIEKRATTDKHAQEETISENKVLFARNETRSQT